MQHVVSVSGGKDSTATYLRALERGLPFRAVFADTGHEHPQTYEYVRSLAARTGGPAVEEVKADFSAQIAHKRHIVDTKWRREGVPDETINRALELLVPTGNPFIDLCLWKGRFPSSRRRFCTEELKTIPIARAVHAPLVAGGDVVVSWQGVRADESIARSALPAMQRLNLPGETGPAQGRLYAWRPLLRWTIEDVFAMHARHSVAPNPLYAAGMGRVGCMPCIMCRKGELRQIAEVFPDQIDRVEEMERLVSAASKRGVSTFFSVDKSPGDHTSDFSLPMPRIRDVVMWSRTSRGGRQYQLDIGHDEQKALRPALLASVAADDAAPISADLFLADALTVCDQWGACE